MDNTLQNAAASVGLEAAGTVATDHHSAHPHRSLIARALGLLGKANEYCGHLGIVNGLHWYGVKLLSRARVPGMKRVRMKPPQLRHAIDIRMYPRSDDFVFDEIFVKEQYSACCDGVKDAKFIMDLGANVGYVSALLATRYPSARILSVEPDPANYEECVSNVSPYGDRVKTLLGAVWPQRSRLALVRGSGCDGRDWSSQVAEARGPETASVEAWDMPSLFEIAKEPVVDILKIDIEGSEAELFAAGTAEWLPRVRNICIELHDERCRRIFFDALREFEYDLQIQGESTLCLNLRPAPVTANTRVS